MPTVRPQVHRLEDGTIKIFSRNMEDMTSKYPDMIEVLPSAIQPHVTSFVIDSEVRHSVPKSRTAAPSSMQAGLASSR